MDDFGGGRERIGSERRFGVNHRTGLINDHSVTLSHFVFPVFAVGMALGVHYFFLHHPVTANVPQKKRGLHTHGRATVSHHLGPPRLHDPFALPPSRPRSLGWEPRGPDTHRPSPMVRPNVVTHGSGVNSGSPSIRLELPAPIWLLSEQCEMTTRSTSFRFTTLVFFKQPHGVHLQSGGAVDSWSIGCSVFLASLFLAF